MGAEELVFSREVPGRVSNTKKVNPRNVCVVNTEHIQKVTFICLYE